MSLAEQVIVFGFDGLRPDMLAPEVTPNICRVVAEGTRFANSRSVFPSETRVATPSFATGCRPQGHGMVGNQMFDARLARIINTKHESHIAALIEAHGGLLARPSLGAHLAAAGKSLAVVWTGTFGAGLCMFPEADALGMVRYMPDGPNAPAAALAAGIEVPAAGVPNSPRVQAATTVLVDRVLPTKPDVAVFWSSEPDVSFHYAGIGSDVARDALHAADAQLGRVLAWRDAQPNRDAIAVLVMSDHGQVTGEVRIDLAPLLLKAGFAVAKNMEGGSIALGGGGAPAFWVPGHDRATVEKLAAWLKAQDFVRLVLARDPAGLEGVLPLATLGALHDRAADLAFTFAGSPEPDRYGLPGRALIELADIPEGGGMHGGLHKQEVATVLAMMGGAIHQGAVSETPADLTDITPSILALLGLGSEGCEGVALAEAWTGAPPPFTRATVAGHNGSVLHTFQARGRIYPDASA
jgi:arylsulfatase A-like enzyme